MLCLCLFAACQLNVVAQQDVNLLLQKVKAKIESVNDYEANGKMKTNVVFLKVPVATIKMYFKKPNKLKIKKSFSHYYYFRNSLGISRYKNR